MAAFPTTQKIASPTTLITANGGFKASVGIILSSYADLTAANANTYLKDYAGAIIATSADILYYRNQAATQWLQLLTTTSGVPISSLTAAIATNDINNVAFGQIWRWNSLSNGVGLLLQSNATQAASNGQTIFAIRTEGDNTNSTQTTYAATFQNIKTGAFNTNVAALFSASSGSNNYAIIVDFGRVGIGTTTPTNKFHVVGDGGSFDTPALCETTGSNSIAIRGTTSGSESTGVVGEATVNGKGVSGISSGSGSGYGGYFTSANTGTTSIGIYARATGATNNYAIIVPTNSGSVGFGMSAPTEILEITGNEKINGQYYAAMFTLTDGATIAVNWNNSNVQYVAITGSRTFTFANPKIGAEYLLILQQPEGGGATATWPTIRWQGGTAPTLSSSLKRDLIFIVWDGTNYYGRAELNF